MAVLQSGGTVVVPSRQRGEAARLAFAGAALRSGTSVWHTPDILPLDAWLARETGKHAATDADLPRLLSPAEDWLLWREATAALTADLDLIARGPLTESLRRAEQLAFEYSIEINSTNASSSERALLRDVARLVRTRQREWNAATPSRLAATLPFIGDERPVLFAGFSGSHPLLDALGAARSAKGWETRTADRTGIARGQVVLATDSSDELERIARWCDRRLREQPDARLLIVLPGNANLRERLTALLRQSLESRSVMGLVPPDDGTLATIEGGEALSAVPMVAHALASLEWLIGREDFESFSARLRAPYWATPDFAARCRVDMDLRERAPLELGLREAVEALALVPAAQARWASDLTTRFMQASGALGSGFATPREWSSRFHGTLRALGWPGDRTFSSDEQQTRERFLTLLKEFGGLSSSWGTLPPEKALRWLKDLAERTNFSPASGDAPITVSPFLADPIVRYDGVWIAGLTATAWPQPVQPDPFLPLHSQLAAGVAAASAAGRLAAACELMLSWSAATDELTLSSTTREGDMEVLPSPLLKEFAKAPQIAASPSMELSRAAHRDGMLESFTDNVGQPWPAAIALPAGTRSIELQNECPFRAYAELRLAGEAMEGAQPGIAADARGNLLHRALEALWDRVQGSEALAALSDEACDALILACVDNVAASLWRTVPHTPAQVRERRRAARLIAVLCRLERERAPFSVRSRELQAGLNLGEATLRVRIDRVDELADGAQVILDYKSGRRAIADWYGERPSHVQLLAYLAALGESPRAIATVNVTAREVRFHGIAATGAMLPKVSAVRPPDGAGAADAWNLRRAEWLGRMERLAREFLAGYAAVDPKPHACDYCHLAALCRIADLGRAPPEDEVFDE